MIVMSVILERKKIKTTSHSQTAASSPIPKYFAPFNREYRF